MSRMSGRTQIATLGLGLVAMSELLRPNKVQGVLAECGFIALAVSAALLIWEGSRAPGRTDNSSAVSTSGEILTRLSPAPAETNEQQGTATAWRWTLIALGMFGGVISQTWFTAGTALAGGDITPPIGTAWIRHLFSRYEWTGFNLGGPGSLQWRLPWAALDLLVHELGGSGALAQRIWLSILSMSVVVAAGALMRSIGTSPLAGAVGAIFYLLNPFTLSNVGDNDVWLVAMALLPALAAIVIGYARGSLRLGMAVVDLVLATPFVGYAYSNPPLVGMLVIMFVLSVFLARLRYGRHAGIRGIKLATIGGLVMVAASAYWLVPAKVVLANVASSSLSSPSSWLFTEVRATLSNGFWLNNSWGWNFVAYYPYAGHYARFPLFLVRPLVPIVAFGILALGHAGSARVRTLIGSTALLALGVVLLSTGTNFPGSLLFDPLYNLPYGWLLREPGRFLMASALFYAMLVAFLIDGVRAHYHRKRELGGQLRERRWPAFVGRVPGITSISVLVVAFTSSFPIWTGSMISGPHAGFPSIHVRVPKYWTQAAEYLNNHFSSGSMLVLPPNDFYQMPYTWYYGSDYFIPNLFSLHVVDPIGQSYDKVSQELVNATALEASELVSHQYSEARRILGAIGTPLVLVRGDIESQFPGRKIVSPLALLASLVHDPEMRLVHRVGPLAVFQVLQPLESPAGFATTTSTAPNLLTLELLPKTTELVTSTPKSGHTALDELPPVSAWKEQGRNLSTVVREQPGRTYEVVVLTPSGPRQGASFGISTATVHTRAGTPELALHVSLGTSVLPDANFAHGLWQPHVGNCNALLPVGAHDLSATVLPHAGPAGTAALSLFAAVDIACEAKNLNWGRGPIYLKMETRSEPSGSPPRICIWEEPENRCASTPPISPSLTWRTYSTVVSPPPGTTKLMLFLYAVSYSSGERSTDQYTAIQVRSVLAEPSQVVVVETPRVTQKSPMLFTTSEGYDHGWYAPGIGTHVEVDGLRNGWLTATEALRPLHPVFIPIVSEVRDEIVLAAAAMLAAALVALLTRNRLDTRRSRRQYETDSE